MTKRDKTSWPRRCLAKYGNVLIVGALIPDWSPFNLAEIDISSAYKSKIGQDFTSKSSSACLTFIFSSTTLVGVGDPEFITD